MRSQDLRRRVEAHARTWQQRVSGPMLLLGVIILIEALGQTPVGPPSPTAFLLLVIVFSSFNDPRWKAYTITGAAILYLAVTVSTPGALFRYEGDNGQRVAIMAVVGPVMAWMTSTLKERAEALAREQEARSAAERERDFVRRVLDGSPLALLVVDPRTQRIEYASAAASKVLETPLAMIERRGLREVLGGASERIAALVQKVVQTSATLDAREVEVVTLAAPRYVDVAAGPLVDVGQVVLAMVDVTERRRAEREAAEARRQALQSEKLAALGTLVSGVAHEIRSPLTVAQNHVQLAKRGDVDSNLVGIEEALDRMNAMVGELRRFARTEVGVRSRESLAPSVQHALRLFQMAQRGKVRVETRIEETPIVDLDRGQVEQVVLNLLENAAAASASGGLVEVEVRGEGNGAVLRVRDHGVGMHPDVRARIFEPFFTTKPDGTGLGLSIVRRIVEAHSATIECDSAAGQGTTFTVRFPVAGAKVVPVSAAASGAPV